MSSNSVVALRRLGLAQSTSSSLFDNAASQWRSQQCLPRDFTTCAIYANLNRQITARVLSSSSSSDDSKSRMVHDNAAVLRAMRKGEEVTREDDKIDYRYRSSDGGNIKSPLDLWGPSVVKAEQERQEQNDMDKQKKSTIVDDGEGRRMSSRHTGSKKKKEKKFVSFFDEVDELIEKRRSERLRKKGPAGASLASLLDKLDNYPDGKQDEQSRQDDNRYSSDTTTTTTSTTTTTTTTTTNSSTPSSAKSIFSDTSIFSSDISAAIKPVRSIFDPESSSKTEPAHNPNAYDTEIFEQYELMMRDEIQSPNFLKKNIKKMDEKDREEFVRPVFRWLLKRERTIPYDLPTLEEAVSDSGDKNSAASRDLDIKVKGDVFCSELEKQRRNFLEETGMTVEQMEVAEKAMYRLATWCAKRARVAPVEVAWEKIKEAGILLSADTMSTLLYVVGTGGSSLSSFSRGRRGRRPLSSIDSLFGRSKSDLFEPTDYEDSSATDAEDENVINVPEEIALCHDLLYDPTESSISLRVKALISKGDGQGAENLMEKFESNDGTVRLRSYLPILSLYCDKGEVSSALKLFKRMRDTPTVILEPENYVLLIAALAEHGCFTDNAEPIEGATELGYSAPCGSELFDQLVTEMAEDVMEISSASARKLYNALAIGFKDQHIARNLKEMHSLAGMLAMNEPAEDDELVASRITVDHKTAICPRTKATLRLLMLEEDQRKQLIQSLHQLANTEAKKFSRGNKKEDANRAAKELTHFADWLDTRTGDPFTAIVDGANAAYYMQNFDQGRFNYHQIQFVVDALLNLKENPLVIVPFKYGFDSFTVTTGVVGDMQNLTDKEREIRDSLLDKGMLYRVPPRCLDDYYWMVASVSEQTVARNGADLDVPPQNEDGRWPGTRPMLVSNDQMRDHKLQLLEPRLFRRWHSSHIVNYNFTAFVDDECVDREIGFSTPDFFSREIQGNPAPGGGIAWHIPVSDWDLDDRFVIRIPTSKKAD